MKVLITGACGFIGSHLTRKLNEAGHSIGIIKKKTTNISRIKDLISKISIFEVDLCSSKGVLNAMEHFKPDIIYHLAACYSIDHKIQELSKIINSNVLGTVNLLEAAKEKGLKLFVNTSSCLVYNTSNKKLKINIELNPNNLYALTKLQGEEACSFYAKKYGLNIATYRLFPPYGPGDHERRLIPIIIRSYLRGISPKLTSGIQKWDYIYVGDIVTAYMSLLQKFDALKGHEIFNIGTGKAQSIREIVSIVKDIIGVDYEPLWNSIPHRRSEAWYICANIDKTRTFLGWQPKTLSEGLELAINWYKSHPLEDS